MAKGTFQIISESYQIGANNLFEYCSGLPWIFKPFFYCYAIVGALVLYACSLIFYVLIIFDYLASIVNAIRKSLLSIIEGNSEAAQDSLGSFIFSPLIICIITPIFILSALLPKISSEIDIDETTGEVLEKADITSSGTFRKIISFSMDTISNLFSYIRDQSLLFMPFLIIPCLINCILMLILILISTPLLLFDLFSYIVDSIRSVCIRISRSLGQSTENGFGGFVFSPILLVLLVPIFIGILIIPKFSTGIDGTE